MDSNIDKIVKKVEIASKAFDRLRDTEGNCISDQFKNILNSQTQGVITSSQAHLMRLKSIPLWMAVILPMVGDVDND